MEDYFKPKGSTRATRPDSGNANIRSVPVFAVVKDNIDPVRSGRLRVYIADFSGDNPDNADSWVTVSYMTPFYGRTNGATSNTGHGKYKNNPHSYGMWNSPPDIGTTVICIFVNGDPNFGFWIGCVPDPDALHMVPAIGATNKIIANENEAQSYGGATFLPVTNINSNDPAIAQTADFLNENKPIHSYSASVYAQQGLIRDNVRGPLTTNAQRETPSRVGFGISTPGRPIYEGGFTDDNIINNLSLQSPEKLKIVGRRGGHTFIMDDGDIVGNDRVVRLRTTLGHQVLLSDSGQCLHIIHANGQSWIELGKEGTIDMYSTNSVNVRTQGDLNLHADNNINIHATKDLSIQADSIKINSEKNITMKSGNDFVGYVMGKYTWKVDGPMAMSTGGEGSYASAGTMFVNGSRINLNTGNASTVPAIVPPLVSFAHTDTLYDSVKGFAAAPGKLVSIVSRAPAHAPWTNAGQGVNVKTTLSSESNLPKPASQAIEAINSSAESANPATPTVSTIATVPPTNPVSKNIDKNTTSGLVSAQAVLAATGPSHHATINGVSVTTINGNIVVAVGKFAMTPKQMEDGGYLKPGTADKIMSNIKSGMPPDKAFDPVFFNNKKGVTDLKSFVNKLSAQTDAQVTNMQKVQTAYQAAGVITGEEAPNQISGPIIAGVQAGVSDVITAIKTVSGNIVGDARAKFNAAKNALGVGNTITNAINTGNLTANLTDRITSGLSSISTSVSGIANIIQSAKTVSAAAFNAVISSFKALRANEPIDTLADNKSTSVKTNNSNLGARIPGVAISMLGDAAGRASGVSNLPGGQDAVDAVVTIGGEITSNSNKVIIDTSTMFKDQFSAITNNISTDAANQSTLHPDTKNIIKLGNPMNTGNLSLDAVKGLPADAAARLQSSLSAISSSGTSQLKLPLVATNTNDRSSVDQLTIGLLNDAAIPPPKYTVNLDREETQQQLNLIQSNLATFRERLNNEALNAKQELENISNVYPMGSLEIEKARQLYIEKKTALANFTNKN